MRDTVSLLPQSRVRQFLPKSPADTPSATPGKVMFQRQTVGPEQITCDLAVDSGFIQQSDEGLKVAIATNVPRDEVAV